MTWTIRRASPADAPAVAEAGARLFREAYGTTHPEPALTPYLAESFALATVEGMLGDRNATLLVAERSDRPELVGYAHLRMATPDAPGTVLTRALPGRRPMEVVRFYVAAHFHGRGLAPALMAACDAEARAREADVLWLQAWQEAGRALAFYRKAGFERIGTAIFQFGQRQDHDFVLARPVAAASSGARPAAGERGDGG